MILLLALACSPSLPDLSTEKTAEDTGAQTDSGATEDSGGEESAEPEDSGETGEPSQDAEFSAVFSLLVESCASCHEDSYIPSYIDSNDAEATYAMLLELTPRSDEGGHYVVPGDPDASLLYEKINPNPAEGTIMPPPTSREPALTADEVALVQRWIAAGAPGQ